VLPHKSNNSSITWGLFSSNTISAYFFACAYSFAPYFTSTCASAALRSCGS
jgi:hypothetical protein